jgi:hypothetical protein
MSRLCFTHTSGDIQVSESESAQDHKLVFLRFDVAFEVWEHIQLNNIFSHSSYRQTYGRLVSDGPVRLTLKGAAHLTQRLENLAAHDFEIVQAVELTCDLLDESLASFFHSESVWAECIGRLVDIGFGLQSETHDELFMLDEYGTEVRLCLHLPNHIATLVFSHDLGYTNENKGELLTLINEINISSLLGAISLLDQKKLIVRVGIPIVDSQGTIKLLSDLSFSVLSMFQETLSLLEAFVDRSISSKEALSEILN